MRKPELNRNEQLYSPGSHAEGREVGRVPLGLITSISPKCSMWACGSVFISAGHLCLTGICSEILISI